MVGSGSLLRVAVVLFAIGSVPAAADECKVAEKMSRALGGSLEDGMIAAGSHGLLDTSVPLRRGRSREYRGWLASNAAESQLASSSLRHTSHVR